MTAMPKQVIKTDIFKSLYFKELIEYEKIDKTPRTAGRLIKTMQEACQILDEIGVTYWISRGTLLGIHRGQNFLPNEIDIDIDVYTDDDVYRIIHKFPYDVVVAATSDGHYMQLAFLDRDTDVIFDIWFYYPYENQLINRNFFGYFLLPDKAIEPLDSVDFHNHKFPTLSDPEWYCRYWYGENWRTPKKYGTNWQLDYERDCKAFVFLGEKNLIYKKYH
jgi:hypothetical protein